MDDPQITEAWVEVRLWLNQRGDRTKMRLRGELRELELNRETVVMVFGDMKEFQPADGEASLRWVQRPWKMLRGAPAGWWPKKKEPSDG